MNKTLEAFIRGYLVFHVNKKYFFRYNAAQRYKGKCKDNELYFEGWHIFKGWIVFYVRVGVKPVVDAGLSTTHATSKYADIDMSAEL